MKKLTVEQQIEKLRPTKGFAANMHHWFLVIAAIMGVVSLLLANPIPLMFGVFFGIIGLSERRTGPNIIAALSAFDSSAGSIGKATISVRTWDMDSHFDVTLEENGYPIWKYEFIPQGWEPLEGIYDARIWRKGSDQSPVLSAIADGVMIPRNVPERVRE